MLTLGDELRGRMKRGAQEIFSAETAAAEGAAPAQESETGAYP